MDWDKLRVFHAVADAGSLTHAGEQLHLSQSAISRQIRGLEDQLQVTLFHRHARGLLLTEQGEILYEATSAIAKRLMVAGARLRDSKDEVHGDLRVTTTAGFGTLWLAPRMARLFDAHPNLSVDLILTEALLDLPMREADVAIRLSSPSQADLIRRPLMEVTMRLYASQDYLAREGTPTDSRELEQHRLITYSPDAPQPHEAAEWLKSHTSPARNSHLRINSYFGVLKAAVNGLGVAALPDYITRDYPDLVNVLPDEISPPIHVYFVYPEELRRSQRILAFRDFILREVEEFNRGRDDTPRVARKA
ncbi:LysR family transcriptional regulator [Limibaculum sp. M0105]|uniref:LysR family transcriptional regulator n=1 Tax=Thermohalobaculum xanthum TaxID=2753746 RepID=A0A8J7M8L3_9RHOB|nr:LysR family transcriptional regulator [Thermohalobaculum xanthum]MBK0399693.1 LysR family transcriptional regulator [Thermohalobaculum xanthum]